MKTHHAEQPDCAACHMPSRKTSDISHSHTVDHDIERVPPSRIDTAELGDEDTFVPVGKVAVGDREFGLAYAQAANKGSAAMAERARQFLARALASGASDVEVEVRLGFLDQRAGDTARARTLYAAALEQNPYEPTALANLAVIDAGSGHLPEATRLLQRLVAYDPSQTSAGLNLAWIECSEGKANEAAALLHRLARLNPDDPALKHFAATGEYAGGHCKLP